MARGAVRTGTPWWKHAKLLLTLSGVLFAAEVAAAFCLGWIGPVALDEATTIHFGNTTYTMLSGDSEVGSLVARLGITVGFAGMAGMVTFLAGKTRGPAWGLAYLCGLALLGLGVGALFGYAQLGERPWPAVLFTVLGFLVSIMHPVAEVRHALWKRSQARTSSTGVRTTATVRRVKITNRDSVNYWATWLEYQDQRGRTYNIKHLWMFGHLARPSVGQSVGITYDPAHPGRRFSVVVDDVGTVRSGHSSWGHTANSGQPSSTRPLTTARETKFVHWKQPPRR